MENKLLEKIKNGEALTVGELKQVLEDPKLQDYDCNIELDTKSQNVSEKLSDISDWLSMLDDMQGYLYDINSTLQDLVDAVKAK